MTRAGPGSFPWGALAPAALGHSGEDHWQSSLENLWTHLWRMPGVGPGRVTWCQIPQYNSWVGLGKLQEPCRRSAVLCSVTSNSFATPWSVACQAPLSMGFSGQECCRLPFPPPGDLPDPGIELSSLVSPALAGTFFYYWATWTATGEETDVQTFTRQDSHPAAKPGVKPPVLTPNPPIHPGVEAAFSPGQWLLCRWVGLWRLDLQFGGLKRGFSSFSKELRNSLHRMDLRTEIFCWK